MFCCSVLIIWFRFEWFRELFSSAVFVACKIQMSLYGAETKTTTTKLKLKLFKLIGCRFRLVLACVQKCFRVTAYFFFSSSFLSCVIFFSNSGSKKFHTLKRNCNHMISIAHTNTYETTHVPKTNNTEGKNNNRERRKGKTKNKTCEHEKE